MGLAESIGRRVRAAREAAGLSQESLAEMSGINRGFLGELERGESSPTVTTLEKVCKALGVPVSELVRSAERELGG
jgi:transcriptional regulator with XRE-family HTH domain